MIHVKFLCWYNENENNFVERNQNDLTSDFIVFHRWLFYAFSMLIHSRFLKGYDLTTCIVTPFSINTKNSSESLCLIPAQWIWAQKPRLFWVLPVIEWMAVAVAIWLLKNKSLKDFWIFFNNLYKLPKCIELEGSNLAHSWTFWRPF